MRNKTISLLLCIIMICSIGSLSIAYAGNEGVVHIDSEADFCKIKRTTATVTINTFEKVTLYVDYNIYSVEDYEFVWSVDGKSYFMNDFKDKTTGEEVELLFLDDTTVKLQIISSNGEVLCEDEIFLKSYRNKETPFLAKLQSWILLPIIVFVGVVGGTIGPWIGKLI